MCMHHAEHFMNSHKTYHSVIIYNLQLLLTLLLECMAYQKNSIENQCLTSSVLATWSRQTMPNIQCASYMASSNNA